MSKKSLIVVLLLLLFTLTIVLGTASAASASAPASKGQRYRIILHSKTYDLVRRHQKKVRVRHRAKYVDVHGVHRYRVVRRARQFIVLAKAVPSPQSGVSLPGVRQSVGRPSWASSDLDVATAAGANDGLTSTRWTAGTKAYPQWWMVDLGTTRTVLGFQAVWNGSKRAYRYRVETSLDGTTFTTVADRSGNRVRAVTTDLMSVLARYVRVQVLGVSPAGAAASAAEFTVTTDEPGTPTPAPAPTATPTPTPTATPTPTPTPTPTATPTPTPTATSTSVSVMSYGARADGVTDDSAAILAAVTAAAGRDVYLPAGTYRLASTLVVPAGARLVGAGLGSTWVKGRIDFNSNSSFTDMKIGDAGKAAVHNATATTSGTSFTRVQFRGGGGSKYIDCQVVSLYSPGDTTAVSDLTFTDCNVECNLGVEDAAHSRHFDNVYIAPSVVAPSIDDVLFRGCRFGVSNGVRTGSPRFNVEIYANSYAATRTHGFRNINFENCVFEGADDENLDYSGSTLSTSPTTPNDGYSHVTGCTFKGNGKVGVWYGDLIVEAGAGYIEIAGNTFYRGAGQAIAVGGNGGAPVDTYCDIHDNLIDPRDATYNTGVVHDAFEYVSLMSNYNTLRGNTLINSSQYRRALTVSGDRNTVSGNALTNAPSGGNVAGLEGSSSANVLTGNLLIGGGVYNVGTGNTVQ